MPDAPHNIDFIKLIKLLEKHHNEAIPQPIPANIKSILRSDTPFLYEITLGLSDTIALGATRKDRPYSTPLSNLHRGNRRMDMITLDFFDMIVLPTLDVSLGLMPYDLDLKTAEAFQSQCMLKLTPIEDDINENEISKLITAARFGIRGNNFSSYRETLSNKFTRLIIELSNNNACWDLGCTTCGQHFTRGYLRRLSSLPNEINLSDTSRASYERHSPVDPFNLYAASFVDIGRLMDEAKAPDWLGHLGVVLTEDIPPEILSIISSRWLNSFRTAFIERGISEVYKIEEMIRCNTLLTWKEMGIFEYGAMWYFDKKSKSR